MRPPLLPDETLIRVYRLARRDGIMVLAIASFFALLSASAGDRIGVIVGLLVAGAGAIELHGSYLLHRGEIRAMRWLISSQFYLMAAVIGYCVVRLQNFSPDLVNQVLTPDARSTLQQAGYSSAAAINELVRRVYYFTYSVVALATLLYQGGMALYYARRRAPITQALANAEREDY